MFILPNIYFTKLYSTHNEHSLVAKGGYSHNSPHSTISVSDKSRFQKDIPHQVAWNLKNHIHAKYICRS